MNIFDILILLAVAGSAVFGFLRMRRRKRCGRGNCACGCEGCSLCGKGAEKDPPLG